MNKYDEAIEYLTRHPYEIEEAWRQPFNHLAGDLFLPIGPEMELMDYFYDPEYETCGCLTQVKSGVRYDDDPDSTAKAYQNEELTQEIRSDPRVPSRVEDITLESLPIFKEYQEKADIIYKR